MKDAYRLKEEDLFKTLETGRKGLDKTKVLEIRKIYGKNELTKRKKRSKLEIFLDQFKNIMVILLIIVGILSLINTSLRYAPPVGKEVKIAEIIIKFVVPISQNKNKINGIILINEYNFQQIIFPYFETQ